MEFLFGVVVGVVGVVVVGGIAFVFFALRNNNR